MCPGAAGAGCCAQILPCRARGRDPQAVFAFTPQTAPGRGIVTLDATLAAVPGADLPEPWSQIEIEALERPPARPPHPRAVEGIRRSKGSDLVEAQEVLEARERIRALIHTTPLFTSKSLGAPHQVELFLKAELFQKTGSFKARGATTRCLGSARRSASAAC